MKKIVFPAIATLSMMSSGSATLTTVIGQNGTLPIVDTAIVASQVIQLPVGSQLYQGPAVACVAASTINIIASDDNKSGSCLFLLNESFGTSAAAGTAAATVVAVGDCSNVDLYFYQKANAQAATSTGIFIKGHFRNVYYYAPITFVNRLGFYADSALTEPIAVSAGLSPKLQAYTPVNLVPHLAYFKYPNDRTQLTAHVKGSDAKLTQQNVDAVVTKLLSLIEYNN